MGEAQRTARERPDRAGVVDVARRAGVSTATVSRVFNGGGPVREDTRRIVEKVALDLDYAPNSFARALASQRSKTLGVIVPSLRGSIFASGLEAIQHHARARSHAVLLGCSDYSPETELALARSLVAQGVDGLILVGLTHHADLAPMLKRRGVPYLCQGAYRRRSEYPCIGFDNRSAIATVADYLVGLGHRRIAVLAGISRDNDRVQERIAGVRDSLDRHGIELPNAAIAEARYDLAHAREAAGRLLAALRPPTAIIAHNDVLAHGAILEAQSRGLDVPGDLSVTGFDDLDFAAHVRPAISTLRVPTAEMGRLAVDLLLDSIEGRARARPRREIPTQLVIRQSTAPPPRHRRDSSDGARRGCTGGRNTARSQSIQT